MGEELFGFLDLHHRNNEVQVFNVTLFNEDIAICADLCRICIWSLVFSIGNQHLKGIQRSY